MATISHVVVGQVVDVTENPAARERLQFVEPPCWLHAIQFKYRPVALFGATVKTLIVDARLSRTALHRLNFAPVEDSV